GPLNRSVWTSSEIETADPRHGSSQTELQAKRIEGGSVQSPCEEFESCFDSPESSQNQTPALQKIVARLVPPELAPPEHQRFERSKPARSMPCPVFQRLAH